MTGDEQTVTVSMSRKINLGNYESAEAFVSISGVKAGMTAEDLAPLMATGKLAWETVRAALVHQVKTIREEAKP